MPKLSIYACAMAALVVCPPALTRADLEEPAQARGYHKSINRFVQEGQYARAKEAAAQWAAEPEVDEKRMAEACALLSNRKIHDAAVVLLARLDWVMPEGCHWPDSTLYYMRQQGLTNEVDAVLTYGTALVAETDARDPLVIPLHGGPRGVVYPRVAQRLFYFWNHYEKGVEPLYARYEAELVKRPDDVALLSEYAYWLARYGRIDEAVEAACRIDLKRLDLLSIADLAGMWRPDVDSRLVRYTLAPLEEALTREMTGQEAARYTAGWQAMVSVGQAKRLFHERLLKELAERFAKLECYEDAKRRYEEYLALPRRAHWQDRSRCQKQYAQVLIALGLPDPNRVELARKAERSGSGKDWAELAAYLQGRGEIGLAADAWERAIEATPPAGRGKVERLRNQYRAQLIKMLDDHQMYVEELAILKSAYAEEPRAYAKNKYLLAIAGAYLKLDRKDEAMTFLYEQLDQDFQIGTVQVILRADHEKTLFEYYSLSHRDLSDLPSSGIVLQKMTALPEPRRTEAFIAFYGAYDMHAEYVDLVDGLPVDQLNYGRMRRLSDFASRCDRYDRAVYWALEILKHVGEDDYPQTGSREYIHTLEDASEFSARAGEYKTSLAYAKKLCMIVPERFYFARALAKCAQVGECAEELLEELQAFARQHPDRWVVWRVLAEVYNAYGDEPEAKACLEKVKMLR